MGPLYRYLGTWGMPERPEYKVAKKVWAYTG
jgi:hypothetical protein